jgi:hypothetical protein
LQKGSQSLNQSRIQGVLLGSQHLSKGTRQKQYGFFYSASQYFHPQTIIGIGTESGSNSSKANEALA